MKMIQQKEGSPDCPPASGLDNWSIEDLASSGLTPDDFSIEPLKTEVELEEHLGFTALADHNGNLIKIIDIGGYWIPYTNVPGYYRLKLKEKIGDAKYLSAQKEKALSNHPYLLPCVLEALRDFKPEKPVIFVEGEERRVKPRKMTFSQLDFWASGVLRMVKMTSYQNWRDSISNTASVLSLLIRMLPKSIMSDALNLD